MEYEINSDVKVVTGIAPVASLGANTDSAVIDTLGYESFEWLVSMGVITTGTFSMVFEESDVVTFGGEETVVAADHVVGGSPTYIATDDGQCRRVGIIGKKQFQRCTLVGASTPNAVGTVVGLLSHAVKNPQTAQTTAE